ncbi:MAG TPA: phosphatase PAP2 family protein [Candidatus Angelobacter sp.]|jgi:membrane-associated phospholipid phosphatase|nr:phosphatase PAP2 family protein [Candidatus Angelobacter sp.]
MTSPAISQSAATVDKRKNLAGPRGIWPIDKLFISYGAITGLLLALGVKNHPSAWMFVLGHAVAIVLILVLSRYSSWLVLFVRHWYALFYVPICYKEVPYIISGLKLPAVDTLLARWDLAMWKTDPVFWPDALQNPLLTEFLQFVYFMFIPSVVILGLLYWYQRPSREFRYCTFLVAATFLFSYLGYVLVPARGPRFMDYAAHHPALHGLWFFHFFQGSLDSLEGVQYDCFPSGHVAVMIVCAYAARKLSSPVFLGFSIFAALIAFSTIYLRYHYMIDVLAGALMAILFIMLGPRVYRMLGDKPLAFSP